MALEMKATLYCVLNTLNVFRTINNMLAICKKHKTIEWLAVRIRGGVEDTRLEAKAKDTKNIRGQGQGQPFRGQTLSRPRTGMLEAKD